MLAIAAWAIVVPDGEKPEFSTGGWIAMMFAAGMGIGLLFYGGYEPLYH